MRFLTAGYPLLWAGFQLGRAPWFLLLAANMRVARAATTFALGGLMGSSPEALNGWMVRHYDHALMGNVPPPSHSGVPSPPTPRRE